MPDTDDGGKTVVSPTTDGDGQAKSTTDPSTDAGVKGTTDPGQTTDSPPVTTGDEGATGADKKSELPDKDTLPFNEHPKWISARKAEQRVNAALEELGFDSIDDLTDAVKRGKSIQEVIGDYDPEQLIGDFEEFQRVKAFWASQKAAELEANESPEETISRLKKEKQDLLDRGRQEQEDRDAIEDSKRVITEFDNSIRDAANSLEGASDIEKAMFVEFMGADNEMSIVDPYDKTAVKKARDTVTGRFRKYISDLKQETIDEYVSGKSSITPITKTETGAGSETVTTGQKPLPKGATMEDANQMAKDELLTRFLKAAEAE